MRGAFKVREVVDQGPLGLGLRGTVLSGQLYAGMEAQHHGMVVIIRELMTVQGENKVIKRARLRQHVIVRPLPIVYDLLKPLEGETLEFCEEKTEPIKAGLMLKVTPM
jgi:hypothetical protein